MPDFGTRRISRRLELASTRKPDLFWHSQDFVRGADRSKRFSGCEVIPNFHTIGLLGDSP